MSSLFGALDESRLEEIKAQDAELTAKLQTMIQENETQIQALEKTTAEKV